jgi:adenosylcobinamide-GDP ribazoletransferase
VAALLIAWGLLTSIKLPFSDPVTQVEPGKSYSWFPVVGLVLGSLLVGVDWGLGQLLPALPAAALLVVIWIAFTGMLHLDGLMDCCDALLPPRTAERRLDILKDVHAGAFGVVGVMMLLILKVSLVAVLPYPWRWPILLNAPILGRWAMVWLAVRYEPARQEGMGHFFRQGLGLAQLGWATLWAGLVAGLSFGGGGFGLLGLAWLAAIGIARWTLRRIPGLTGDVYGAACELVEVVILLAGLIVLRGP